MTESALSRCICARAALMKMPVSSQSVTASGSDSISGPGMVISSSAIAAIVSPALPPHASQRRHQQALRIPRRSVGFVPGREAEIQAGAVQRVIDDEAVALSVLALLNRSDASGHVSNLAAFFSASP